MNMSTNTHSEIHLFGVHSATYLPIFINFSPLHHFPRHSSTFFPPPPPIYNSIPTFITPHHSIHDPSPFVTSPLYQPSLKAFFVFPSYLLRLLKVFIYFYPPFLFVHGFGVSSLFFLFYLVIFICFKSFFQLSYLVFSGSLPCGFISYQVTYFL